MTPLSDSVLPSITNKSLRVIAEDLGMKVEMRPIPVEELSEFEEVNACGTAVVITPIRSIDDKPVLEGADVSRRWEIPSGEVCGRKSRMLYDRIRGIQDGIIDDSHGWCIEVC